MKNINKDNLNDVISITKKILKLFYLILIVVGIYVLLRIIKELGILSIIIKVLKLLSPLFIGIIVAWLLNPFVRFLEKNKVNRKLGSILAYVILIGFLFLLIKALIPIVYNQTLELVENFPKIFNDVKEWIINLFSNFNSKTINISKVEKTMIDRLDNTSIELSKSLPSFIINFISSTISSIGMFLIGLVIGFFLLLGCNNYAMTLLEILPKRYRTSTKNLCLKINKSLRNYVNGALVDALIVFIVSTVAFAIIGLKSPVIFGIFCGLMNVIPYAGPYIGGAPAVVVAFSQSTGVGIAVLIAIIIIQSIEGNILQALIISKATKLNPVTIIVGLLVFGYFFGIVGMLLSTPIIGVLKVVIEYFDEKYDLLNFK